MDNRTHEAGKSRDFSLAFEQMCGVVAMSQSRTADETLLRLVKVCLTVFHDQRFSCAQDFIEMIDDLFGLQMPAHEIQEALDHLVTEGSVQVDNGAHSLKLDARAEINDQIEEATSLEKRVKENWLWEIAATYPTIPTDQAWKALRGYLQRAFRRHGIQTAALLDPSMEIAPAHSASLSDLLREALVETDLESDKYARPAIAGFFTAIDRHVDRAKYITQLADAAYGYFSLTVAPDTADQMRHELSPLTLFLDTNFLFGILDLHTGSQVAVSNHLLDAITEHTFPFRLRYHEATQGELDRTIAYYGGELRSRVWPRSLSRAAAISRHLSGLELKYHRRHAEVGIDVDSFLRPYQHTDILLKEKNIDVYRPRTQRLSERNDLLHEYSGFLQSRKKKKPYESIDHDVTVLDQVRQLRSAAESSLEARALLLTCDYHLYRFDWESSREKGLMPCTVLPNLLWQILRPFVPMSSSFDQSFAATFAIPEFRVVGSDSSKACSTMMHILAGYKDISEQTAARMLSNDLLIERLRTAKDDDMLEEYVREAFIEENNLLVEENAELQRKLAEVRRKQSEDASTDERRLADERQERLDAQKELDRARREIQEREREQKEAVENALEQARQERSAREQAEQRAQESEIVAAQARQKNATILAVVKATGLSIAVLLIFEGLVHLIPCHWLLRHQNSLGIQLSIDFFLVGVSCILFFPRHWKWILAAILMPIAAVIFQII